MIMIKVFDVNVGGLPSILKDNVQIDLDDKQYKMDNIQLSNRNL